MVYLQISELSNASSEAVSKISNDGIFGALFILAVIFIILIVMHYSKREKDLQSRINHVIDNHMADLRENTKDAQAYANKYYNFVQELKSLFYSQSK